MEPTPENPPDLDGYTVREAWENGWHKGRESAAARIEELEEALKRCAEMPGPTYPMMEATDD